MALNFLKNVAIEAVAGALSKKRFRFSAAVAGLWAGAFIVFMAAFGFAAFAFYLFLAQTMTPLAATSVVSAALFGVVIIMVLIANYALNRQRSLQRETDEELQKIIALLAQQGYEEIREPIQENPALAVGVSALAGFMASRYL